MSSGDLFLYAILSSVVGLVFTVLARLIDRWLPDPDKAHPLPAPPDLNGDGKPG